MGGGCSVAAERRPQGLWRKVGAAATGHCGASGGRPDATSDTFSSASLQLDPANVRRRLDATIKPLTPPDAT